MQYVDQEKLDKVKLSKTNFYVAIDFDKTITSTESCDSWNASGQILGKEFKEKSEKLCQKYSKIEQDYDIEFNEKNKAMEKWYSSSMELYYEYNLTKEKLQRSVNNSNLIFRTGAKEFLTNMYENNIPVVILSAGIGNVIEQFLKNNNCYYDNIYLISNFIMFDKNGNMKKYEGELIHTLNKNIKNHTTEELEKKVKDREYRLLFGDFIEDKSMVPNSEWNKTISIGFLGKKIKENLEIYRKNFDIVLTQEDATFDVVKNIYEKRRAV